MCQRNWGLKFVYCLIVVVLPTVVFADYVDIVGDDSHQGQNFSCVMGNIFDVQATVLLKEQEFWLAFDGDVTLHMLVYKSRTYDELGTYDLIDETLVNVTGYGVGAPDWYGVDYLTPVTLMENYYYILAYGVIAEPVMTYWATPEGELVSFGAQTHGTEFACTDPAALTVTPPLQPKRYHQRIVTDDTRTRKSDAVAAGCKLFCDAGRNVAERAWLKYRRNEINRADRRIRPSLIFPYHPKLSGHNPLNEHHRTRLLP